jgi:hypothetical protein
MMVDIDETLRAWRAEIASELAGAEAELEAAAAIVCTAEAAAEAAGAAWAAIEARTYGRVPRYGSLAGALAARVAPMRRARDDAPARGCTRPMSARSSQICARRWRNAIALCRRRRGRSTSARWRCRAPSRARGSWSSSTT